MTTNRKPVPGAPIVAGTLVALVLSGWARSGLANGGPFVVKYPSGDPAAKGVLARLHTDLKPAREERLRVMKEDLSIQFTNDRVRAGGKETLPPLAVVKAEYRIKNPSKEVVEVDFGFPILRGIYVSPFSMVPRPDVRVAVDGQHVKADIISNSAIYGIIRQRARAAIDQAISSDAELARRVGKVRKASARDREKVRGVLYHYLEKEMKWSKRDAVLMVEYCSLDTGKGGIGVVGRPWIWEHDAELRRLMSADLGVLGAIGEKKATQLFAQLAGLFDPAVKAGYEDIFAAWGGDVRERSVDLRTGRVRPREVTLSKPRASALPYGVGDDLTIYARVEYLDANAKLTGEERESCKAILKNLPVIFTFAPMNLLHYKVTFAPGAEQTVSVRYSQYAYVDSCGPRSYQLAYVVHPASLWREFGPINLTVHVPQGSRFAGSVPCKVASGETPTYPYGPKGEGVKYVVHKATLKQKTGELFVAVSADDWERIVLRKSSPARAVKTARR